MPTKASDDEFKFICPYMMLWDVIDMGRVAGGAAYAAAAGTFDGKVGSKFDIPALGDYEARTFEAIKDPDNADSTGSVVVVGKPYVFEKNNMAKWKDVL